MNHTDTISRDTQVMMEFHSRKKSIAAAYVLWFVFGLLGAHRFYAGRSGSGLIMLGLTITIVGLLITSIWWLVDAFLIPGIVERRNHELRHLLSI